MTKCPAFLPPFFFFRMSMGIDYNRRVCVMAKWGAFLFKHTILIIIFLDFFVGVWGVWWGVVEHRGI